MSKSKFQVEFTLKQHTPMIHFQSDQKGATLRATELKPKLDRFLLEQFEKNGIEYKDFLISGQEKALDYKVKIIKRKISDDKVDLNGFPDDRLFMGNMGGGNTQQMYHRNSETTVIVNTFNTELKKKIEEKFSDFMFQTNFGGGSSKGFGSFTVKEKKVSHYPDNCYYFKLDNDKLESVYNSIFYFYKMLKSGINEYDKNNTSVLYGKSLLWLYTNFELNTTWDKKIIKKIFLEDELTAQRVKYPNSEILESVEREGFIYRDLLGLSLESDWMSYSKTITKSADNISRFPSPIRFKPILEENGYIVYFWGIKVSEDILNKNFTVSDGSSDFEISTPIAFDIGAYLNFVSQQNIVEHIDSRYHHTDIFKTLKSIFNTITKVQR